jgi:hypothetical protein
MARDVLVVNKLTRNGNLNLGSIAAPANGVAFNQANGQVFTPKKAAKVALLVYNSKAGAINVTIRKGVYPPAEDSGVGDLVVNIPTTAFWNLIGPFDGSRFLQKDGTIQVDTDAAATGAMYVVELPV